MKILYVMPTQYTHDGRLFKEKKAFFPTLTLPYLAGLTPPDVDVEIRNDYIEEIDTSSRAWDLVGISVTTLHSARGYELADAFRAAGTPVVLGGFHATFMTDEAAAHADAVVVGEGEFTLPQLLADFRNGGLKPRYEADTAHPMTGLPAPRYDLIPYRKYEYRSIPVQTSRGCPHGCRYCTVTAFHGNKFRFRPVEEVIEETRTGMRVVGANRLVMFIDDNIAANRKYARRLFEALIPLRMNWVSQCAFDMADDPELVRLAARSGMRGAFIGVETLNENTLKKQNKGTNKVKEYAQRLRVFRDAGVSVSANMIFGFDGDDEETFRAAAAFIRKHAIFVNPYILTPYPGTKLFEDMESQGRLLHRDWSKYTAYQQVLKNDTMPREKIEPLFWKTYLELYSPWLNFKRMLNRPLRSFLSPVDWYLHIRIFFFNATFISRKYIRKRQAPYF